MRLTTVQSASIQKAAMPRPRVQSVVTTVAPALPGARGRLLHLQRTLGNRYVSQLLQGRGRFVPSRALGIQAKLMVAAANDQYEQEADRVARQVVMMPEPTSERMASHEEERDERLQARTAVSRQCCRRLYPQIMKYFILPTSLASGSGRETIPISKAAVSPVWKII